MYYISFPFILSIPLFFLFILFFFHRILPLLLRPIARQRLLSLPPSLSFDPSLLSSLGGHAFPLPSNCSLGYRIISPLSPHSSPSSLSPSLLPLVIFPGVPGSRFDCLATPQALRLYRALSLQLLIIERPSFGLSSPPSSSSPSASLALPSFSADVLLLLNHLGVTVFALFAFSSGGLYAHHLLHILRSPPLSPSSSPLPRCISATLLAAQGPICQYPPSVVAAKRSATAWFPLVAALHALPLRLGWAIVEMQQRAQQLHFLFSPLSFARAFYGKALVGKGGGKGKGKGEKKGKEMEGGENEAEEKEQLAVLRGLLQNLAAIHYESPDSAAATTRELALAFSPSFPYSLSSPLPPGPAASRPFVYSYWHGTRDRMRPIAVSKWQVETIKEREGKNVDVQVRMREVEGGGHGLHLFSNHWKEMCEEIVEIKQKFVGNENHFVEVQKH